MVFEKKRSYYYKGEMKDLIATVEKIIFKMNLTIRNKVFHGNFFKYDVSEKIQLITMYWPLNFEIMANEFEKFILLDVRTRSTGFNILQDAHSNDKLNEFMRYLDNFSNSSSKPMPNTNIDVVKPTVRSTTVESYEPIAIKDDLNSLKMRYKNGEITKEEYKKLRKKK